jgi:aspartyl aminopeptidase
MSKKTLEYTPKSCWEIYDGTEHAQAMDDLARRYLDFLSRCKTEREVTDYVVERATAAGFTGDFSSDAVVLPFRGKAVFLARKGKRAPEQGSRLISAHSDSPRLDLKQRPITEESTLGQAKTHYYGGLRKHQWLARPLALHGVVVKKDGTTVKICLGEDPSDPVFTVPDLLPHLAAKQMDQKLANAFEAEKLNILLGHAPIPGGKEKKKDNKKIKAHILKLLHDRYDIVEEDLYSAELQAVPAGPARFVGLDGSLLGGYGHDDRICVFTSLESLLSSKTQSEHTRVAVYWDKEEIGSDGSAGAKSRILEYWMDDMLRGWFPKTRLSEAMLNTKAVSADVHGGLDPDYQDLHEKLNAAQLGYGPCFSKFTGHRGKYAANDAHAEYVGWLRGVMDKAGVPWQMAELGKVDQGGGGTVAKHLAEYGMDIIDFGPPVLGMHSPFEIASKADLYATCKAYKAFLES